MIYKNNQKIYKKRKMKMIKKMMTIKINYKKRLMI